MKISKLLFLIIITFSILLGCSKEKSGGINPLANFDAMWDYNNPVETEQLFIGFLSGLKNSAETSYDQNYHVELLTQIARTQGMQGKFDVANQTLEDAKDLFNEKTKSGEMRYLLEKGRILNSSGNAEESQPIFLQAYNFGLENRLDFHTLDAIHMLGIVESPNKQVDWNMKAIDVAENSLDTRCKGWLGPLYNNIGWSFHDQKDYESSMKYFQKGYDFRKTQADDNATRIAKWTIGRCHRSLGDLDKAKKIMLELETEIDTNNLPKDGYVYEELAELYLLENSPKSKEYFKMAYDIQIQDNWIKSNETEKLTRMQKLFK